MARRHGLAAVSVFCTKLHHIFVNYSHTQANEAFIMRPS